MFITTSCSTRAINTDYCSNALNEASTLRNLVVKQKVECKKINKKQFQAMMSDTAPSSEILEKEEIAYKMTGFIPEDYDYSECFVNDSSQAISATYIPSDKKIYLPEHYQEDVLVHEAVHALQDQHFNLEDLSKKTSISTDAYLTFSAIAEGDAELVQRKYLKARKLKRKNLESKNSKNKKKNSKCVTPQSILFQLDFPYFWGARYLSHKQEIKKDISKEFLNYPKSVSYTHLTLPTKA